MLSRIEGPLSDAVRVSGLAYGVGIQFSTWTAQIYLSIYESSSLAAAWDAICKCLDDFRAQLDGDDQDGSLAVELDTAKASMLFTLNRSRSSPGHISLGALSRSAIGAPASPAADQALEGEIEKVSVDCLKRVFDAHVKPLYMSKQGRIAIGTCGLSVVAETIEQFSNCTYPVMFEECSVEDLYPKAIRRYVK